MPLVAAMVLGSALVLAYAAYASIRDSNERTQGTKPRFGGFSLGSVMF
jgi:hypothetical protein